MGWWRFYGPLSVDGLFTGLGLEMAKVHSPSIQRNFCENTRAETPDKELIYKEKRRSKFNRRRCRSWKSSECLWLKSLLLPLPASSPESVCIASFALLFRRLLLLDFETKYMFRDSMIGILSKLFPIDMTSADFPFLVF